MEYTQAEILQTVRMTEMEHLDIRTVTLGLSLRDCASDSVEKTAERVREKIERMATRLVQTVVQSKFAMIIVANMSRAGESAAALKERFRKEGERLGVRIYAQREDLFNAMHRI